MQPDTTTAPKAEPAAVTGPVKLPFAIMDDELEALRRFDECARDFEAGGHDVRKEMMKRLAEIGLVRRVTANIYEHTTFGLSVLGGDFDAAPTTQAAPQPAVQQGDSDSACARQVWWTHNKAKFTTTRQSAFAAWDGAVEWRTAAKAKQSASAPAAQGDAEQREVDARHAAIYRWMLGHPGDAWSILDDWCTDEEAGTDELHDALAARAAKEGAKHG